MKKLLLVLMCLLHLSPAARAEETKYAALLVTGGPNGEETVKLLAGLEARGARATFFLRGEDLARYPEVAENILELDHEIALQGYSGESMAPMSRRAIARSLQDTRSLLPQGSHPRFFAPPQGVFSDGIRQVAKVSGLAMIEYRWDAASWAQKHQDMDFSPMVELVQEGDFLRIRGETAPEVNTALEMIDRLQAAGFRFVTISELARRKGVLIRPGRVYGGFGAGNLR